MSTKILKSLLENKNEIPTYYAKIAETFNSFFKKVVNILNIEKDESILFGTGNEIDPVKIAITNTKYQAF